MPSMLRALFLSTFAWRASAYHVCYGYFGGVADLGWTYSQNLGRAWADETLGTTSYYEEGVYFMPEADQRAVMDKFVHGTGGNPAKCDLIFMGSDVLERLTVEYAGLYPHVKFVCAAGMTTGPNLTGVYPRPYQGYFLGGMLAALQPGVKKVGYIGSMYSPSSIINVNAVALGMRAINSSAKLYVQHVGEWFWPRAERIAGLRMIEQHGVDLLFYDSDSTEIVKLAKEKGIFSIAVKSDGTALHGESNLMSVIYVWNTILVDIVSLAMSNETHWLAEKDRNIFVGVEKDGISTGTFSSHVPAVSRMRVKEQFDKFGAKLDEVWCHPSFETYCPTGARGWERGIWPCEVNKTVHTPNLTRGDTCLDDATQLRTITWFIKDAVEDLGFLEVPSECSPGSKMDALAAELCVPCESGKYTDEVDQTECITCGAGYYNEDISASDCNLCPAGSYTSSSTECVSCPRGKYSQGGVDACTDCPLGYSLNREGGTGLQSCDLCEIGTFANATGTPLCTSCQAGLTTVAIASIDISACVCATGFFQRSGEIQCSPCPLGMTCAVGSAEVNFESDLKSPVLREGYWSSNSEPLSVFECDLRQRCPGGSPGTCSGGVSMTACDGCSEDAYMSPGGQCLACSEQGHTKILFVLCFLLGVPVMLFVHKKVNHPLVLTQSHGQCGVFLLGMAITAVLTINIYEGFSFEWGAPLADGFQSSKAFSLNLDFLVFECSSGTSKLLPKYLFQLAVVPIGFLTLITSSGLLHIFPKTRDLACFRSADLQNTLGHLFSVFLIAMTLMSIAGFKCMTHPNERSTLYADHTIMCWEPGAHAWIVLVSVLAVLVYPIAFLSGCGVIIWKYSTWASLYGTDFTFRTRFLVSRMEPEKYFFGYFYIVRSFLLSMMPLMAQNMALQVLLLQSIWFSWLCAQMVTRPWRFPILNRMDCLHSVAQVLILSCLGLMHGVRIEDAQSLMWLFGWFVMVMFCAIVTLLMSFSAWCIYQRLRNKKEYAFLLTHHRAGAGLFARLVKCIMEGELGLRVFLDVDQLGNLDNVAFLVRTSVQNLLILQTSEVYARPWCAVEIVSAVKNNINILVSVVDTNTLQLSDQYVQSVMGRWGDSEVKELSNAGIAVADVELAYRHVAALQKVEVSMEATLDVQVNALRMITTFGGANQRKTLRKDVCVPDDGVSSSGTFLVYDTRSPVQTCVAHITSLLLKDYNWACVVLNSPEESLEAPGMSSMLVLMSAGANRNPLFLGFITAWRAKALTFCPAVSQEIFNLPDPALIQWLRDGKAFTPEDEQLFHRIVPNRSSNAAAKALQDVYKVLAWRFNPQATEKILREEFLTFVERGLLPAAHSWSSQGSEGSGQKPSGHEVFDADANAEQTQMPNSKTPKSASKPEVSSM